MQSKNACRWTELDEVVTPVLLVTMMRWWLCMPSLFVKFQTGLVSEDDIVCTLFSSTILCLVNFPSIAQEQSLSQRLQPRTWNPLKKIYILTRKVFVTQNQREKKSTY